MALPNINQNLTDTHSAEQKTPETKQVLPSLSQDETIEQIIGGFGWSQFLQALLVSVPTLIDAQQIFISIFADAHPKWHCNLNATCSPKSNICELPKSAWYWVDSSHKTIISEWGLECASSFIMGLPASSFFLGCLIGGFTLAIFGDFWLGRRKLLYLSCLTMCLASLLTAFSVNIWMYSALRLISGFGRAPIISCSLIFLTERVGKRWRGQIGSIGFFSYAVGLMSLSAIAYLNRGSSWRKLYLYTSISSISFCIMTYFFVYESPRWLFMQGRDKEAVDVLRGIASIPVKSLDLYTSVRLNLINNLIGFIP
ncbi:organic cation/carnitine transporter 2 [Quercus suber]|uniref:organic cation/carnitine transporter 2 n=1 Tax=Quercus suber TaxID=58331 RepID=UPI0032DF39AE